jgi:hypothetical protein
VKASLADVVIIADAQLGNMSRPTESAELPGTCGCGRWPLHRRATATLPAYGPDRPRCSSYSCAAITSGSSARSGR